MISNTEFDAGSGLSDRPGSDGVAASLLQRFSELGFEHELLPNASLKDLEEKFKESKIKNICIFCIFIISITFILRQGVQNHYHILHPYLRIRPRFVTTY